VESNFGPVRVAVPIVARATWIVRTSRFFAFRAASGQALSDEVRAAREAKAACVALVLMGVSVFGVAEVPAALPMLAPVIGLSLALPLAIALWMNAMSPRHARLLAELAAVALVAIGCASLSRATAVQVSL
jgi:hypothetical protein